jgi:hypothetical protein
MMMLKLLAKERDIVVGFGLEFSVDEDEFFPLYQTFVFHKFSLQQWFCSHAEMGKVFLVVG